MDKYSVKPTTANPTAAHPTAANAARTLPTSRKTMAPRVGTMVQVIAGCKWSLTVFELLRQGVNRPGAMVRTVEGLSTKALNECMRRLLEFELVERTAYPEVPPRVEYAMTAKGTQLLQIFDAMDRLEADFGDDVDP